MVKVYYDQDADFGVLQGKKIAVVGYGSQGHAQALNLKDSGLDVVVALHQGSASWAKAEAAGLTVLTVAEAAQQADIIQILVPDEIQAGLYKAEIGPYLTGGKAQDRKSVV